MNKKAFTLIELLSVIVILSILISIAFFSYSRYLKSSRRKVLEVNVKSIESAARNAISDCNKGATNSFCSEFVLPEPGESVEIKYSKLIESDYVEKFKNPYSRDIYCDIDSSYVYITRKSTTNVDGNVDKSDISFDYETCLICNGDQNQEIYTMARIMKKKGISNTGITKCTGLNDNQIDKLD